MRRPGRKRKSSDRTSSSEVERYSRPPSVLAPLDPQCVSGGGLDLCDELGLLVIGEAFDEWSYPKEKHRKYLSAGDAPAHAVVLYNVDFNEWAERDLKDMISRDFNHPSIILWSIGNEIEWTYPYYQQVSTYDIGNLDDQYGVVDENE